MPAAKSPRKAAAAKPLPVSLPTEAEVRAADLELQETTVKDEVPTPDATTATAGPQADAAAPEDRETRVRRAAYAAYQRRGSHGGDEVSDWLAAEREVDGDPASR